MKISYIEIEASSDDLRAGTTVADAFRKLVDRISSSVGVYNNDHDLNDEQDCENEN